MYSLKEHTLAEILRESGERYGDRPAFGMIGARPFTYREVAKLARKVAVTLSAWGVRAGDKVALLAENSPMWPTAFLGASLAGAVLVPILNDFTPEQIGNIVRHSEARLVLVSAKLLPKVRGLGTLLPILDVTSLEPAAFPDSAVPPGEASLDAQSAGFTPPARKADDPATIVYTSGTMGLSKGVILSHRNILSNAAACRSIIVLRRTDRVLSVLPLAHTYEFTIGFIIPFMHGSSITYLDRPPSATVLLPALKSIRPTIMLSVPLLIEKIYRSSIQPALAGMKAYSSPVLRPILERFAGFKLKKTFGGRMRFFGIGGAPLAQDVEAFLKAARFPYAIGYGLTETSPLIAGCSPRTTHLRSTGPALTGVSVRIKSPKPDTGEGEIQAKGPNVFLGYFKDPDRTRDAFTEDGWFRTGDLGMIDGRKRLFVRGRLKTMILGASGENIYPEEIEAVINRSPYVVESLVYGDESGLTALIHLKSEVLENIGARMKDGLEEAGDAATRLGHAVAGAEKAASEKIGHAVGDVEKAVTALLEKIRKEANEKLAAFSRIRAVRIQDEPFEKTPTQKIKRFLYPKHDGRST